MSEINNRRQDRPASADFGRVATTICEQAINDAKQQLHPLMRDAALHVLRKRSDFMQAFKLALEQRTAQTLASWMPNIQAIFRFDESWAESRSFWDGTLHLLVKVPNVSKALKFFASRLDESLIYCLQQLDCSRFRKRRSILDVQQVTPTELRHGTSYGAMFYAVYSVPEKVWSPKRRGP